MQQQSTKIHRYGLLDVGQISFNLERPTFKRTIMERNGRFVYRQRYLNNQKPTGCYKKRRIISKRRRG